LIAERHQVTPQFGALVRAEQGGGDFVYGLIYDVSIEDDAFVRQLVAAGLESPEIIEDQRRRRQVPVVIEVLSVGAGSGGAVMHRLPAQPPRPLDIIVTCTPDEIARFTDRHDWIRLVLGAAEAPVDQLLIAALRGAAEARPEGEREGYLEDAARIVAGLLALDTVRLDGILRAIRD
jgi:hypothetical protein